MIKGLAQLPNKEQLMHCDSSIWKKEIREMKNKKGWQSHEGYREKRKQLLVFFSSTRTITPQTKFSEYTFKTKNA